MKRLRILIAGIRETNPRLSAIFSDCELTFVGTLRDAKAALARPYDALLIAVRFDESRMFDLLRHVKGNSALQRLPVICYRSGQRALRATALGRQAVELAARALGASDFVDLLSEPNAERGNQKFHVSVFHAVEATRRAGGATTIPV